MTNIWPIKKFGDSAKRKVEDKLRHHSNPSQKKVLIKKIVNYDTEKKEANCENIRENSAGFCWTRDKLDIGHVCQMDFQFSFSGS